MSNWVGKRLGKVQIESLVARGGVAEIYLGTHTTLERKVAVKILRNLNEDNSDALFRFQREARVVAKLRHPNIVQVHDFDTVDNDPYLVMEYIEGPSLSKYLKVLHEHNGRLEMHQVVRLLNAVASALQYAHNNGVIHRDIKPGNILLTSPSSPIVAGQPLPEDFEPVLTDFGLVRFLDSHRETTTGHIAGTPAYMSPEQARGETTDRRTDVYSLGIVLYEILAGHIPFDGETTLSILLKQVNEPPPPIPGLSPFIQSALGRALAKDVKDRFQTPMEFANAFREALDMEIEAPTIEIDNVSLSYPPPKRGRSAKKPAEPRAKLQPVWIRIALLAVLAIALAGFFAINGFPATPSETITPTIPSTTYTNPSATYTITPTISPPLGPNAILRFQNGTAIVDQAALIAQAMPAPLAGNQYEIWLTGADERVSLGTFMPDNNGKGRLTYSNPDGLNLIAQYDTVEVTIEPKPDPDPETPSVLVYSFTLPAEGLTHLRYLLSSFPNTPDKTSLIQGLFTDVKKIDELAKEMQDAIEAGNKVDVQKKAEAILNLLVGAKSSDRKDWNHDGLTEMSKSYGLLLNGSNFGYIQAVYTEADSVVHAPGATQYMIENGETVKTCTQNLALWTSQLRGLLLKILTSTSDTSASDVSTSVRDAASLADQMFNGIDLDTNGKVDILSGECGAKAAYAFAYYMADMPILSITLTYQLTAAAASTSSPFVAPTRTRSNLQNNNNPAPATAKPKSTKKPNPTHKPPNTKRP